MLLFILSIYITIGAFYLFTSAGRWLFNSMIWAIPLLPFMTIYYLIYGDARKKHEAIEMLKLFGIVIIVTIILFLFIKVLQVL